jgi:undecaprenyl-diphosphooligosaccharide--protein glycosyltransferase
VRWWGRLAVWHRAVIASHAWMTPQRGQFYAGLALVVLVVAAALNFAVRDQQCRIWQAHPAITHLGDMPLFSTADAPHFLAAAVEIREAHQGVDTHRADRAAPVLGLSVGDLRQAPLLSVIVASLAEDHSKAAIARAAHAMIPWTAALTVLMVTFTFGVIGYWCEGAAAGLGGGLSFAYLSRSAAGRIDTDQLSLGLFYLLFGLALWAGRLKTRRAGLAAAVMGVAVMGVAAHLFDWWYGKPELIYMPVVALLWVRLVVARDAVGAVLAAVLVLVLSGTSLPKPWDSSYIQPYLAKGGLYFPNIIETVSEVQVAPLHEILPQITGSLWLGIISMIGLVGAAFRHPAIAIAYAPLAGFVWLNYVLGNRAIFYAPPALWFGGAWVVMAIARYACARLGAAGSARRQAAVTAMAVCHAAGTAYGASPRYYMPQPTFSVPVMTGFSALATAPPTATIASWWDYGHASWFLNGLPILSRGGGDESTYFMARALVSDDLDQSAALLRFAARDRDAVLPLFNGNAADLDRLIAARRHHAGGPVYLVLTGEMINWMASIRAIARWDIDRGQPGRTRSALKDSSYIKLFHYGASHHGPFALIYDDYPHVRVFKLDGSG